ncbi:MAG: YjjG family noncanonical pyrimidine nucleotidase [Bacteroidaceae bacterium]|nr:YjjG family noncanonical pyrimidine nucleotidase [Bacteroidaceae bacterium]
MKYRDLFIDFDDTLYDTYGNAVIALEETFEAFHLDQWFPDPKVFYDAYWAANIDLWSRYAKGEIDRPFLIVERFRRPLCMSEELRMKSEESVSAFKDYCLEISDRFLDFCSGKPGVVDGARELMDYLRGRGYRMHMCSNGFHEVQYKKLAACGLRDYFQTVILSEDAGANKPSKDFFDYAFKVSGAERETTIMIGDNLQTDILGARDAGLDTILFNRWNVEPSGIPTHTVTTLHEIKDIL